MARQTTKKAAATKATADTNKEDAVTADTVAPANEAPAQENTENTQATPAPAQENKAADAPVDTSAFDQALTAALAEMDPTTGTLAEAQVAAVVKAYQELDGAKPKAAVRAAIERGIQDALSPESGDIPKARALNTVRGEITKAKGGGKKADSTPADPTENFVQQVVALQLAYSHVTQNVPEGVSDDWQNRANELAAATVNDLATLAKYDGEGEKPEVSPIAVRALKLATGKVRGGAASGATRTPFTGTRRDVSKHITEAFADKAAGDFMTVAQIVAFSSSEYGAGEASPGAVSARLFPKSGKCTVEGIEPVDAGDGHPKGARKVA